MRSPAPRFEDLTETTGIPVTEEGADMMYTRYALAAERSASRRVLELGCGAGQGFGLLLAAGCRVIGGDYSLALLRDARAHYQQRVPLVRLSADRLPFADASFDVVLLFEALYYVPDPERCFDEIARVLGPGGEVLFVNANPERPDFIRSPHSHHYHSASEFVAQLGRRGFDVTVQGAFPVAEESEGSASRLRGAVFSLARRILEGLHLTPRTLRGRARLKRLINRNLRSIPRELPSGFANVAPLHPLPAGAVRNYKVIYAAGRKNGARSRV